MTAADNTIQASGRWSARVASSRHRPTEDAALGRISAPESSALSGTALSPAERAAPKAAGVVSAAAEGRPSASSVA